MVCLDSGSDYNSITSRFLKPMTNIASSLPSTATRSQFFDGQTLLLLTGTQLEPASQITIMSSRAGQKLRHTACRWIYMAKKLATSNLPFQVIEGFIQTQNKNNFSNLASFFFLRKSSFCTLAVLQFYGARTTDTQ